MARTVTAVLQTRSPCVDSWREERDLAEQLVRSQFDADLLEGDGAGDDVEKFVRVVAR